MPFSVHSYLPARILLFREIERRGQAATCSRFSGLLTEAAASGAENASSREALCLYPTIFNKEISHERLETRSRGLRRRGPAGRSRLGAPHRLPHRHHHLSAGKGHARRVHHGRASRQGEHHRPQRQRIQFLGRARQLPESARQAGRERKSPAGRNGHGHGFRRRSDRGTPHLYRGIRLERQKALGTQGSRRAGLAQRRHQAEERQYSLHRVHGHPRRVSEADQGRGTALGHLQAQRREHARGHSARGEPENGRNGLGMEDLGTP